MTIDLNCYWDQLNLKWETPKFKKSITPTSGFFVVGFRSIYTWSQLVRGVTILTIWEMSVKEERGDPCTYSILDKIGSKSLHWCHISQLMSVVVVDRPVVVVVKAWVLGSTGIKTPRVRTQDCKGHSSHSPPRISTNDYSCWRMF